MGWLGPRAAVCWLLHWAIDQAVSAFGPPGPANQRCLSQKQLPSCPGNFLAWTMAPDPPEPLERLASGDQSRTPLLSDSVGAQLVKEGERARGLSLLGHWSAPPAAAAPSRLPSPCRLLQVPETAPVSSCEGRHRKCLLIMPRVYAAFISQPWRLGSLQIQVSADLVSRDNLILTIYCHLRRQRK